MKLVLPKQHGAWAMLLIPFLLGVVKAGPSMIHIPLFLGWFLLYLATYPILMVVKNKKRSFHIKWSLYYFVPAVLFLLVSVVLKFSLIYFGLSMLPFFVLNIYYAKKKQERALLNDISAILVFGIGGLSSYFAGADRIDGLAIILFICSILFFLGSTFYVKTMIREKTNVVYKWVSWGFHFLLLIGFAFTEYPLLAVAFVPSLLRAVFFYGKPMSIVKVGIYEIINAVYFFIILLWLI